MPRPKIIAIFVLLIAGNVGTWLAAFYAFHSRPELFGIAFLAYSFGLRHAFDADHIAAIDNVTRKLMQEGRRPFAAGFYFWLGHSTVVVVLALVIAVILAWKFHLLWLDVGASCIVFCITTGILLITAWPAGVL